MRTTSSWVGKGSEARGCDWPQVTSQRSWPLPRSLGRPATEGSQGDPASPHSCLPTTLRPPASTYLLPFLPSPPPHLSSRSHFCSRTHRLGVPGPLATRTLPPRPLHPAPLSSPPSLPLPLLLSFVPPSLAPFPRRWPARPSPGPGGCWLPGGWLLRARGPRRGRSARPLAGPGRAGSPEGPS